MNAEIISVGTELLLGETINTDAADVARLLSEFGINVFWQTVVGDNPGRVKEALKEALSRADLVITTGGLGPTEDDLTKEMVAEYFGLHVLMFVISMLVAEAAVHIIRVPKESRGVLWCLTAFMNNAFIGFPLAAAIYGEQAVFYAAISNIPFNLLLYTVGMAKLRQGDGKTLSWRKIFTPPLVTTLLAAVIYLTDLTYKIIFIFRIRLFTFV